jgi:hypothetical protein
VLAETGASHVALHDYFGRHMTAVQKHTKAVKAAELGIIGKEHLYRLMEIVGGDPKTFTYNRSFGETNGIPRVIEFAFGIHRDGLAAGGRAPARGKLSPA